MKKLLLALTFCFGSFALLHAATPAAQESTDFHKELLKTVGSSTVKDKSKAKIKEFKEKKYVFVYFSAHWCPPCRKFTPELVKFYNDNIDNGDFDLLFVSSDRSQSAMDGYMKETEMPWLGVKLGSKADKLKKQYGSTGIPHLVLLDENDKVIARGQGNVMQEYLKLTKAKKK